MAKYVGFKIGKVHESHIISEYYCGGCGWPVTDHDSFCPECDARERQAEGARNRGLRMNIDKSKLKVGLWYTDEEGNYIPYEEGTTPDGAVYAHSCFPLEVTEHVYKMREDGSYGEKDRVLTFNTNIGRGNGRLIVAMVNSGDYDLYDAIAVYASACERCMNVLWDKYLPGEDGYAEFSEKWHAANTVCDFCRGLGIEAD